VPEGLLDDLDVLPVQVRTMKLGDLYALHLLNADGSTELVLLDLGTNELGRVTGMALYTGPDGQAQREHLGKFTAPDDALLAIYPVTYEELHEAMSPGRPASVLLDGEKVAGSVFRGMLKSELGLPIKYPRFFEVDRIFHSRRSE
jgi:hypothetical protein